MAKTRQRKLRRGAPARARPARAARRAALFDAAPDLLALARTDGTLLEVNAAWDRLLGRRPEPGARLARIIHPDDAARAEAMLARAAAGEEVHDGSLRLMTAEGAERLVAWRARATPEGGILLAGREAAAREAEGGESAATPEERFEAIFEHSDAAIFLRDRSGVFLRANRRWREITGRDDPAGRTAREVFGPAAEPLLARDREVFATGLPFVGEERILDSGGRERITVATKFLIEEEARTEPLLCCLATDVTEERRRERELAALRKRFEAVVENAASSIFMKRRDGRFLLANRALREKIGRDDLIGLAAEDINPPGLAATFRAAEETVFRTGRPDYGEERFPDAQGREAICFVARFLIDDPELGEPVLCGVSTDITESRRRETALDLARQRFEAMFENVDALVYAKARDGRYIAANRRLLALMGGRDPIDRTDFELHPPHVAEAFVAADREVFATGRSVSREETFEEPDGRLRHWLSTKFLAPDPDLGEPALYGVSVEITEQKRLQARLEESRRAAEAASLAKSRFLATMSHEIRTPLNGVLGMADLLCDRVEEPEHLRMLETIRVSGQTLMTVLNDVLDCSKIESGKLSLERARFSPADLARRVGGAYAAQAEAKGLALEIAVDAGAETPRLGDPHRIGQILHNLLSNAVKFTARGRVRLEARGEGETLVFVVADEGVGMSAPEQALVFEEFFQADSAVTRRFGGTGLGLSIVRGLTAAMGGRVALESAPGRGAAFTISLPLPVARSAPAPAAPEPPGAAAPARGLRVLAADDHEINRMVLSAFLGALGATATMVGGGCAAVEAAEADAYDLLMLDIAMPDLDGVAALRAIREREQALGLPRRPAVACTANALPQQVATYLAAGFDAHLAKPLGRDSLEKALSRFGPLRPAQARRAVRA